MEVPPISPLVDKSQGELCKKQSGDRPIHLFLKAREKNKISRIDNVRSQGPTAKCFNQLWNELLVKQGILWRQYEDI